MQPAPQPIEHRVGGFGGVEGLTGYLMAGRFTHLIDATHPFAARISANARAAAQAAGVAHLRLTRAPWVAQPGDRWQSVAGEAEAAAALPDAAARVFLAIGKQHLAPFAARPQHHYLLRLVDAPEAPPLPLCRVEVARGPFDLAGDLALLRDHGTQIIVARNAGGTGARAKIDAARLLGLPVLMIARPPEAGVHRVEAALAWLNDAGVHGDLGVQKF